MTRTILERHIQAPPERVFSAVAEIRNLPQVVPAIQQVEVLVETESGIGTRFRETRLHNGKPTVTELEVTELDAPRRVRMVADSHGTVWDTVFKVRPVEGGSELELCMEARAHKLVPKLLNPLFKGLIRKGLERHVDALQAWCESPAD